MNFSDGFIKILDAVCDKLGIGIKWTGDNILPYIQQLVTKIAHWEIATSIIWIFVGFAILALAFWCKKRYKEIIKSEHNHYSEEETPYIVIGVVATILSFMIFIEQGIDIATAITFPEKTAIEFMKEIQHNE